ncbi:hypothetical protein CUT44_31560 [Streptomyces carminius]|uniref:Uncharacterized protein n=1 Tax=Streptomyces carminius TaxID=2665496 RepID=A0A2M8LP64_9ACTN|nr:DUF5955 family protein [Streptomyces carminius]PJE93755.1 hypothetical protein CUT44_31560 [Streptomyces carminius]
MREETVERRTVVPGQDDPRVTELNRAVTRLHRELAGYRGQLADRGIAEEELRAVDTALRTGAPEVARLRHSLLLIAGAIGSVSALSEPLGEFRNAVELFGRPAR